eukprot:6188267-Pleurochrysis_carterae.AAC.1
MSFVSTSNSTLQQREIRRTLVQFGYHGLSSVRSRWVGSEWLGRDWALLACSHLPTIYCVALWHAE